MTSLVYHYWDLIGMVRQLDGQLENLITVNAPGSDCVQVQLNTHNPRGQIRPGLLPHSHSSGPHRQREEKRQRWNLTDTAVSLVCCNCGLRNGQARGRVMAERAEVGHALTSHGDNG